MKHLIRLVTAVAAFALIASTAAAVAAGGAAKAGARAAIGKRVGVPGVQALLGGTTERSDGKFEVTYNGHPLYYFVSDRKPGQTTGQALNQFGGPWWVLSPAGREIHRG